MACTFSPDFASLMSSVGSVEYTMFDLNDGDLSGSDKSQLSTETTYELGYSNKIGDKFSFSVDLYNIRKQNISSMKRITHRYLLTLLILVPNLHLLLVSTILCKFRSSIGSLCQYCKSVYNCSRYSCCWPCNSST